MNNEYEVVYWFTLEEVISKLYKETLNTPVYFEKFPLYRIPFSKIFYKSIYKSFPIWDIKQITSLEDFVTGKTYHFILGENYPQSTSNITLSGSISNLYTNKNPFQIPYSGVKFTVNVQEYMSNGFKLLVNERGYDLSGGLSGLFLEVDFTYSSTLGDGTPNKAFFDCFTEQTLKPYIDELWQLIYSRYKNHYVFYNQKDEIFNTDVDDFAYKLMNLMSMTYDKYAPLISLYKENENKLMNDIKASSKGKVRFNDTPQDGGDYSDDAHTTNITQSETENSTAGATPIERLDEIKRKISMLYKEWSDEFDVLFVEEGNI